MTKSMTQKAGKGKNGLQNKIKVSWHSEFDDYLIARLNETKGKRWFFCWYQSGPFTIIHRQGVDKFDAREKVKEWLSHREIINGIYQISYGVKRKAKRGWITDWFIYEE